MGTFQVFSTQMEAYTTTNLLCKSSSPFHKRIDIFSTLLLLFMAGKFIPQTLRKQRLNGQLAKKLMCFTLSTTTSTGTTVYQPKTKSLAWLKSSTGYPV